MYTSPAHIPYARTDSVYEAIDLLKSIYQRNISFLHEQLENYISGHVPTQKVRAYYPSIKVVVSQYTNVDARYSYGYFSEPGEYLTSITQPQLFTHYFSEQLSRIRIQHPNAEIYIGESDMAIPIHFAISNESVFAELHANIDFSYSLRDYFDTPDLDKIDDSIVNGKWRLTHSKKSRPLALFTAARIDYSLKRLEHYTNTSPTHFQSFILFTNYAFYVEEFRKYAREQLSNPDSIYAEFVEPGNCITKRNDANECDPRLTQRIPQMPTYHLKRDDGQGITLINIGVGPSNAKNITDHLAVLRPNAWIMVGHCAGLRDSQNLGDYVLAHAYARYDQILDKDLPLSVPIPALAEIQQALERAVAETTGLSGWELKRVMRTGTVATISDRNWELEMQQELIERFILSRSIALDMESATIAANGFRYRIPYGTLLCVSDKPLHGELKLPGMASSFYKQQVAQHLQIGIKALELLAQTDPVQLHSRKLRGYLEAAFK